MNLFLYFFTFSSIFVFSPSSVHCQNHNIEDDLILSLADDIKVNLQPQEKLLAETIGRKDDDTNSVNNQEEDFEVEIFYNPKQESPDSVKPNIGESNVDEVVKEVETSKVLNYGSSSRHVKRLWGVDDTEAFVGRHFIYPIPEDAFRGDVIKYEVRELIILFLKFEDSVLYVKFSWN